MKIEAATRLMAASKQSPRVAKEHERVSNQLEEKGLEATDVIDNEGKRIEVEGDLATIANVLKGIGYKSTGLPRDATFVNRTIGADRYIYYRKVGDNVYQLEVSERYD